MAEYDLPYDYLDIVGPIYPATSTSGGSLMRAENEVVRNIVGNWYTDNQVYLVKQHVHSSRSRSAGSLIPSRRSSAISLVEKVSQSRSQSQSDTAAPERYDVTLRFPKMYDTGSVFRVKCCRKVVTLVNFLLNLLERMERVDAQHHLTDEQSLNEFVKKLILVSAFERRGWNS
ncbi:unnamed protein product [Cylicostephanus goldi]|uniref:Uncharacterized protein n=1 Tax=Cylicostephanus goldi TaxID=71465 RepID=A0A3P6QRX2_CYLGO|nr:unnamed protein product [Cylicostephanus goldi]